MKNSKTNAATTPAKNAKTTSKEDSAKVAAASSGATRTGTGATERVRAHSGRGLGNEGTNVSYEDEGRNG